MDHNPHTMTLFRSLVLTRGLNRSIEDAVGNAFLQLLAETDGQGRDQVYVAEPPFFPACSLFRCLGTTMCLNMLALTRISGTSPNNEIIQAFARDVRRRKEEPPGSYDDFIDLAASAAARVLACGPNYPDECV